MYIIPTILCGGAGSRLWPVSRDLHPKPFIRLMDGQSLLQKTFIRAAAIPGVKEILVDTNQELFFKTLSDFKEVNVDKLPISFILEPLGRNTAAAVASSAIQVTHSYGEDAILLVLPADHLITEQKTFIEAVTKAISLAQKGQIVTFGIQPDHPETGYGYIEANGTDVMRFVEKPSLEKAQHYLDAGNFLWNSGMFCFSAGAMLSAFQAYSPDILKLTKDCFETSKHIQQDNVSQIYLNGETFINVPSISIDYAIMEKIKNVSVIPCELGWRDIGSWDAFSDLVKQDENGNSIIGEAEIYDVKNCFIQSDHRIVGAVGISDMLIVDTADALLISDKAHAQDVKCIYGQLKAKKHETSRSHRMVHRPWGAYTVLEVGEGFKIKRIEVNPLGSLSLQKHYHRSEHWVVVSGTAKIINGDNEILLRINESTFIPAGNIHRLENPGKIPLVLIEVQSGEYLGEDDIVRLEDVYGRS